MSEIHNWACVKDGKVEKVVRWDGVSDWPPAADYLMIDIEGNLQGITAGWDYVDGKFVNNLPEPEEE